MPDGPGGAGGLVEPPGHAASLRRAGLPRGRRGCRVLPRPRPRPQARSGRLGRGPGLRRALEPHPPALPAGASDVRDAGLLGAGDRRPPPRPPRAARAPRRRLAQPPGDVREMPRPRGRRLAQPPARSRARLGPVKAAQGAESRGTATVPVRACGPCPVPRQGARPLREPSRVALAASTVRALLALRRRWSLARGRRCLRRRRCGPLPRLHRSQDGSACAHDRRACADDGSDGGGVALLAGRTGRRGRGWWSRRGFRHHRLLVVSCRTNQPTRRYGRRRASPPAAGHPRPTAGFRSGCRATDVSRSRRPGATPPLTVTGGHGLPLSSRMRAPRRVGLR